MATGHFLSGFAQSFGQGMQQGQERKQRDAERKLKTKLFEIQLQKAEAEAEALKQKKDALGGIFGAQQPPSEALPGLPGTPQGIPQPGGATTFPLPEQGGIADTLARGAMPEGLTGAPAQSAQSGGFLERLQDPQVQRALVQSGVVSLLELKTLLKPQERRIETDAGGFKRFVDSGERLFPDASAPRKSQSGTGKLLDDIAQAGESGNKTKVAALTRQLNLKNGSALKPDQLLGQQQTLRKASDNFLVQRRNFNIGMKFASAGTNFGDISLIFAFMKVLDPGSRVTSGEVATTENAGNINRRIRNLYNKLIGTEGEVLGPTQRQDIVNRMGDSFAVGRDEQLERIESVAAFAERHGINPEDLIPGELRPRRKFPSLTLPKQNDPSEKLLGDVRSAFGGTSANNIVDLTKP